MSWLRASSLLPLVALFALGCINNTVELEFESEPSNDDTTTTTDDTGMSATIAETTDDTGTTVGPQTMLLVLSTPLEPSTPFQALVTATPSTGTVDLTLQWLSLDPGSTNAPRQPVGDQYVYAGIPVDAAGFFYWDTGVILLPGAANPVSAQDLVVSIQMGATPAGDPVYCGQAGGVILMPFEFPLDGATHSMNAADPGNLPIDFPLGCPP